MWRNGVVMAMEDIVATDIVATDILATDTVATDTVATDTVATMVILLMEVITGEGTIVPTTGLITQAIMATHMVATTAGININEDSGLASGAKAEEDCGSKRANAWTSVVPRTLTDTTMLFQSEHSADKGMLSNKGWLIRFRTSIPPTV
jgi:hypothetical protein